MKDKMKRLKINARKNSTYSSVYTVVAFIESLFLMILGAFMQPTKWRILTELISIIILIVVCVVWMGKARGKIESQNITSYDIAKEDRVIVLASDFGYFSPLICVIGWVITLPDFNTLCKVLLVLLILGLSIIAICWVLKRKDK